MAGRGGACLLAVPRPRPVGQAVLTAVVHVLVQVLGVQGAGQHLLEVEAGLGDALHHLAGRDGEGGGTGNVAKGGAVCGSRITFFFQCLNTMPKLQESLKR